MVWILICIWFGWDWFYCCSMCSVRVRVWICWWKWYWFCCWWGGCNWLLRCSNIMGVFFLLFLVLSRWLCCWRIYFVVRFDGLLMVMCKGVCLWLWRYGWLGWGICCCVLWIRLGICRLFFVFFFVDSRVVKLIGGWRCFWLFGKVYCRYIILVWFVKG